MGRMYQDIATSSKLHLVESPKAGWFVQSNVHCLLGCLHNALLLHLHQLLAKHARWALCDEQCHVWQVAGANGVAEATSMDESWCDAEPHTWQIFGSTNNCLAGTTFYESKLSLKVILSMVLHCHADWCRLDEPNISTAWKKLYLNYLVSNLYPKFTESKRGLLNWNLVLWLKKVALTFSRCTWAEWVRRLSDTTRLDYLREICKTKIRVTPEYLSVTRCEQQQIRAEFFRNQCYQSLANLTVHESSLAYSKSVDADMIESVSTLSSTWATRKITIHGHLGHSNFLDTWVAQIKVDSISRNSSGEEIMGVPCQDVRYKNEVRFW